MDLTSLTLAQIKKLLKTNREPAAELLEAMLADKRTVVQELYRRCVVIGQKREADRRRQAGMWECEIVLREPHHHVVAGVDEAGRGPLAGPVVAAAVVLPPEFRLEGLNDSKKLTPVKRENLDAKIKKKALGWAVGIATVGEIYEYNIHHASMLAMLRAVDNLNIRPDLLLVDGKFKIPGAKPEQKAVIGGDGLCPSIAAASIVTKVTRDRLMNVLHYLYPEYGFDRHKGYGTAAHLAALSVFGPCPVHRRGFTPVRQLIDGR